MLKVGLIDYHAGNIRSIVTAFAHLGAKTQVLQSYADSEHLTHLVLPGVGAFNFCFEQLKVSGMLPMIEEWTFIKRKPILGICVGMQLLAESSDEMGLHSGLGWMKGKVQKLNSNEDTNIRIPHVGWNTVLFEKDFGEYTKNTERDFYFDHSHAYYSSTNDQVLAKVNHGQTFCAAIRQENIVAVQFHPEKSQTSGMKFLQGFLSL